MYVINGGILFHLELQQIVAWFAVTFFRMPVTCTKTAAQTNGLLQSKTFPVINATRFDVRYKAEHIGLREISSGDIIYVRVA